MTEENAQAESQPEPAEYPKPAGFNILIKPAVIEETSAGGIIMPSSVEDANKHLTYVGKVVAMGDQCYTHDKFKVADRDPKPWCKVGDYVIYKQYAGNTIKVRSANGGRPVELLMMYDDEIKGVIDDPVNYVAYT